MRASSILGDQLREGTKIVHAKRWSALWRAPRRTAFGLRPSGVPYRAPRPISTESRQPMALWAMRVSSVRCQNSTQFWPRCLSVGFGFGVPPF